MALPVVVNPLDLLYLPLRVLVLLLRARFTFDELGARLQQLLPKLPVCQLLVIKSNNDYDGQPSQSVMQLPERRLLRDLQQRILPLVSDSSEHRKGRVHTAILLQQLTHLS